MRGIVRPLRPPLATGLDDSLQFTKVCYTEPSVISLRSSYCYRESEADGEVRAAMNERPGHRSRRSAIDGAAELSAGTVMSLITCFTVIQSNTLHAACQLLTAALQICCLYQRHNGTLNRQVYLLHCARMSVST